jgi:hypothetical protein
MTLFQFLGGLCLLLALFLIELVGQRIAWARGYTKGWKDAEDWIVKLETEVDQARQEIWKEGV